MTARSLIIVVLTLLAPSLLWAQESQDTTRQAQSIDFKGPQIRDFRWDPVQVQKGRSVRFQAEVTDDDLLDFARLSLSMKGTLKCESQDPVTNADQQSIVSLLGVSGRANMYETELAESHLQQLTGAQRYDQACYRLEAQDRSGNLSFRWIPAPVLPAMAVAPTSSGGSFRKWGVAIAAAVLVAVLVASTGESDDSSGSNSSLLITAPVPVP